MPTPRRPAAELTAILPGSPAAKAGLEPGDVVLAVDTHAVDSAADLQERLYTVSPGDPVQLEVARAAGTRAFTVRLAGSPEG